MPRHPRARRGPRRSPDQQAAGTPEPAAAVRALVQAGIITAAALEASDDLTTAAGSLHRLGQLTSGMWRALSRELATAAERLDRHVQEHLDDLQRRAQALQVEILTAGPAALDRRAGMLVMFSGIWRSVHERARAEEPALPPLPDEVFTILSAGLEELIRDCIRARGPAALPDLADPILRTVFAIFGAGPPA